MMAETRSVQTIAAPITATGEENPQPLLPPAVHPVHQNFYQLPSHHSQDTQTLQQQRRDMESMHLQQSQEMQNQPSSVELTYQRRDMESIHLQHSQDILNQQQPVDPSYHHIESMMTLPTTAAKTLFRYPPPLIPSTNGQTGSRIPSINKIRTMLREIAQPSQMPSITHLMSSIQRTLNESLRGTPDITAPLLQADQSLMQV